jgi:hypothetical protein
MNEYWQTILFSNPHITWQRTYRILRLSTAQNFSTDTTTRHKPERISRLIRPRERTVHPLKKSIRPQSKPLRKIGETTHDFFRDRFFTHHSLALAI